MKNFLIIGGSSGIGASLGNILAKKGHKVYSTFLNTEPSEEQQNIEYHFLDVLSEDNNLDFIPEKIDGLVYAPGSINLKPFSRFKVSDFAKDYELQVLGAVKILQHVLPRLKKSSQASVVMFSTVAVQKGYNFHSQVSASKGAIEGLTRSLAAEWAPSIRVNAIAPSLTQTKLAAKLLSSDVKKEGNANRHPLKRIGRADDIAEMAAFLLSDKSSWITGQVMAVDGGMSSIS